MNYICVNCGIKANLLYKEYSTSVLKISYCEECKKPVDKYIETDTSIVLIDAALQRLESYRHFIYNNPPKLGWKFAFICIICDAYSKWFMERNEKGNLQSYLELEWTFYIACFHSLIDNLVFFTCLWSLVAFFRQGLEKIKSKLIVDSLLIVTGCGKLFTIPSVLWGVDIGEANDWLVTGFILTSLVQTCRALGVINRSISISIVLIAFSCQKLTNLFLLPLIK